MYGPRCLLIELLFVLMMMKRAGIKSGEAKSVATKIISCDAKVTHGDRTTLRLEKQLMADFAVRKNG